MDGEAARSLDRRRRDRAAHPCGCPVWDVFRGNGLPRPGDQEESGVPDPLFLDLDLTLPGRSSRGPGDRHAPGTIRTCGLCLCVPGPRSPSGRGGGSGGRHSEGRVPSSQAQEFLCNRCERADFCWVGPQLTGPPSTRSRPGSWPRARRILSGLPLGHRHPSEVRESRRRTGRSANAQGRERPLDPPQPSGRGGGCGRGRNAGLLRLLRLRHLVWPAGDVAAARRCLSARRDGRWFQRHHGCPGHHHQAGSGAVGRRPSRRCSNMTRPSRCRRRGSRRASRRTRRHSGRLSPAGDRVPER